MADTDIGQGNAPTGKNLPAGAQANMPSRQTQDTNGDYHPSVEGHDHVFDIENGN